MTFGSSWKNDFFKYFNVVKNVRKNLRKTCYIIFKKKENEIIKNGRIF